MFVFLFVCLFEAIIAPNFKIPYTTSLGVGSSAYQTEGSWNEEGKGPSVWDTLVHSHPEIILDNSYGDVACDSFHFFKQDVENAHKLGSQHYIFSISWSRILPHGTPDYINPWAVDFYYNLIMEIRRYQMKPIATLYHWDLPQAMENLGGWLNPDIVDHFANYARIVFDLYGHAVDYWITIDSPLSTCINTYELNQGAPIVEKSPGIGCYVCGKHMLLAHSKAYRLNRKEFLYRDNAVGITFDATWAEPKSNTTDEDIEAAERELQMTLHWFTDPILSYTGDYSEIMRSRIDELSAAEGFADSRLPYFTEDEMTMMKRAFDFVGLKHFQSYLISPAAISDSDPPSFDKDRGTIRETDPEWGPIGYPEGLRKLLNHISNEYRNPLVYVITGYKDDNPDLDDEIRNVYMKAYLKQAVLALNEDGCQIETFTAWSLMDQFEWREGYKTKSGLFQVDFSSSNKTRTIRKSGKEYAYMVLTRIAG